jgi:hypothetical protein
MTITEQWRQDGYLKLPGVLDLPVVNLLRLDCERSFDRWKETSDPDVEPGGFAYGPQGWVLLHLNHPKYHTGDSESLPRLLNVVGDPRVQDILRDIFREDAVMCQINLYVNPPEHRNGGWHRDCQFYPENLDDEEAVICREADPPREIHMHIPLIPTAATELVPGTHCIPDTDEQHYIRWEHPESDDMPGARSVELEPGDLAFFHVNSIHRGRYFSDVPRRTIAITFVRATDTRSNDAQQMKQRNGYVAHYQPWFLKAGYLDGCSPEARQFYDRFVSYCSDS